MISHLKHLVEVLRSAFWPLPSLLVVGSFALAETCLLIDNRFGESIAGWFPDNTSPEGVRSILSTAASGVITLAALVFSTTLVALTLASSQFGPRLLHNFIRARCNQITLGLLVGTFLFCLIVLRSTRVGNLPHLSVLVAFLLTLGSLAFFLFFVHHLVRSLQAENIVEAVANRLFAGIERAFPELPSGEADEDEAEKERVTWDDLEDEISVTSKADGYLQYIDTSTLLELATKQDCRLRVIVRPGQLLLAGGCLFAYERSEGLSKEDAERFVECLILGKQRTPEQDFEFEIRQLVEVGVRALSPGINDPFTAANCIDLLAIAMGRIAKRSLPKNTFFDDEGILRLRLRPTSFRNLLDTAFLQLRHDGAGRPDICIRLFEALHLIGQQTQNDDQLSAVIDLAKLIKQEADERCCSEFDAKCYDEIFRKVEALEES